MNDDVQDILKRVGWVSVVVSLLTARVTLGGQKGTFSFNADLDLIGLVGGICVIRGSLRASGIMLWLKGLVTAMNILSGLSIFLRQPLGLTLALVHLDANGEQWMAVTSVLRIATSLWVIYELQRPELVAARAAAGLKTRTLALPLAIGSGIAVASLALSLWSVSGSAAMVAKAKAEEQMGRSYHFTVTGMSTAMRDGKKITTATVAAWLASEVNTVIVSWQEPD